MSNDNEVRSSRISNLSYEELKLNDSTNGQVARGFNLQVASKLGQPKSYQISINKKIEKRKEKRKVTQLDKHASDL